MNNPRSVGKCDYCALSFSFDFPFVILCYFALFSPMRCCEGRIKWLAEQTVDCELASESVIIVFFSLLRRFTLSCTVLSNVLPL